MKSLYRTGHFEPKLNLHGVRFQSEIFFTQELQCAARVLQYQSYV